MPRLSIMHPEQTMFPSISKMQVKASGIIWCAPMRSQFIDRRVLHLPWFSFTPLEYLDSGAAVHRLQPCHPPESRL